MKFLAKIAAATTVVSALLAVGPARAQQATPSDLRTEFGLKSYALYQQDFLRTDSAGFVTDPSLGTDTGPAWYDYWKPILGNKAGQLANLRYYLRLNGQAVTDANYTNFENVQRVMRIMPKKKFESMFPYSTSKVALNVTNMSGKSYSTGDASAPAESSVYWHTSDTTLSRTHGQFFSYESFLEAVALLPGFCGSYADYPDSAVAPQLQQNADLIARKLLASVFAHAVQETSDSGQGLTPTMAQKLGGTFASIVEGNGALYPDAQGIFRIWDGVNIGNKGELYPLTLTDDQYLGKPLSHNYCGRGTKQTSYPTNYANASLILFGDLRLLAYPELIEEPGVMGFLSGLIYALLPKDSNPSIVEVMDGTFHRKLQALSSDPTVAANPDYQSFVATYDLEFPLTILLVNGGPECSGQTKPANNNNTKIRIEAYNYFVRSQDLLLPVQVSGQDATPPDFTPTDPASTSGDQYLPATSGSLANSYYNLTGNVDSCLRLMVQTINAINSANAWQTQFVRPLYFGPTNSYQWDAATQQSISTPIIAVQNSSGGNLQIFGGEAVHDVMALAYPLAGDTTILPVAKGARKIPND